MLLFVLDQKEPLEEGKTFPSCKQKECLGARDVLWCVGKQGDHETVKCHLERAYSGKEKGIFKHSHLQNGS